MKINVTSPWSIPGQIRAGEFEGVVPYGACDPEFRDRPSALLPYVYDTVMWRFKRAAGPPVVRYVMDVGVRQAFTTGQGDSGVPNGLGVGFVKTFVQTNLYKGGAPVDRGELFVAQGMVLSVMAPVVSDQSSPGLQFINPARTLSAAQGELGNAFREAVIDGLQYTYSYANTACQYEMGPTIHWGGHIGVNGSVAVSNGTIIPGSFHPFRAETIIAARDESKQLTINVVAPGGTGENSIMDDGDTIVVSTGIANPEICVPIRIMLMGYPICARLAAEMVGKPLGSDFDDEDLDKIAERVANRSRK